MGMDALHARFIVGVVGNIVSACLFLSPSPTFYRIIKNKSVEEFKVDPYLATVMNCGFWAVYGMPFVTPNSILVSTINGVGLVLELIYITIYIIYSKGNKKKWVGAILGCEVVLIATVSGLILWFCHGTHRSLPLGIVADFFNIIMYASPLTVMRKVIKTKSVEYMPFWLSLTNFLNAALWMTYALIKLDIFILISNVPGTIFGVMQLILYKCYWKSTPKDEDKAKGDSQIEPNGGIDRV